MADSAVLALLFLERRGASTTTEVAEGLKVARSSAARILKTLHARGFVVRDLEQRFVLGPALLRVATNAPGELAVAAKPHMQELSYRLGETVLLAIREGEESVIVAQSIGSAGPLRIEHELGHQQPLSRGASGLAILAHLPLEVNRAADSQAAATELAIIRAQGFARTEGDIRHGMVGVAVPIFDEVDFVIGSLAVVVPLERAARLEANTALLQQTVSVTRNAYLSLLEAARVTEGQRS